MHDNYLLSIIIPVFNTSCYLIECLESIPKEDKRIEIICINDGSSDNSLEILEKYRKKYSSIKIINKKNEGVAIARNTALKLAKGEYISFIDSDDYIDKKLFENCFEKLKNNPDIIIFGAKTLKKGGLRKGQYSSKFFKKKFAIKDLLKYYGVCWNKIYKKSLIIENNICFSLTKTAEDQAFAIKSLILANKIEIIKKDLYIYRKNHKISLTRAQNKADLSAILINYEIENFLLEKNIAPFLYRKIMSRYILKAASAYSKQSESFKEKYFLELEKLYNYMNSKKVGYWWKYYNLKKKSSYISLKLEYINSLIKYHLKGK